MSRLNLYLLGPPRIECDGRTIRMDTRKAIALLAYIAITGERLQRDALTNLFWPEYDAAHGRANLRRTLYGLRNALPAECLDADRESVQLDLKADVWLDVDQFRAHRAECLTHGHPDVETCPACLAPLTAASELYRGDFLSGFTLPDCLDFDDWQMFQADGLRRAFSDALEKLVQCHCAQGSYETAIEFARRWLALDRLDEQAHCQLMQLYTWSGERSATIRQYQECVQVLKNELGVSPQTSTTELFQAIAKGHIPPPPLVQDRAHRERAERDRLDAQVSITTLMDREHDFAEGAETVFVARERELNQLCQHLDDALAGQGKPVFVTGGAGRGKTVLIQEFARRAQDHISALIFAGGNCNANTGLGDPYLPFREILGLLTGDVDALWAARAITREHARRLWDAFPLVAEALVDAGPDLIETFISGPALARRAAAYSTGGMATKTRWLAPLENLVVRKSAIRHDPSLQQSALFEQYVRVVTVLAGQRPLLLVVDDLQWADRGSISLLFHLGRRLSGRRILIIGAYRPEEVISSREGERHPLEAVINEFRRDYGEISIDLAQTEDLQFVEAYLDAEPNLLSADFRKTLFRQTQGHPLFTAELLSGMRQRGDLLRDADGRWAEGPTLDWETLPARVEAVIAERIARLPPSSRETLRAASVEGETFTAEVVARVLSTDERAMVKQLSRELEHRHRLVRAQEIQRLGARRLSRYRFRHFLFQNYLYDSLDPVERAYLHESIGKALEDLCGDETEEIAVSLARHFREAGIAEKAITYLLKAGERAKRGSANEEAIAQLTQGLEMLNTLSETPERNQRELDLQIALGVPLVLTKGHSSPEVERTYSRTRELSEQVGDDPQRYQALLGLRRFYLYRGELQTAHELGEQLLALAQRTQDSIYLSRSHMMHGEILYRLGDFETSLEHCKRARAAYDPRQVSSHIYLFGNDTEIGSRIFAALDLWHLGYPDQALETVREMLDLAYETAHSFTLVFALYFAAMLHQFRQDVQAVQELTDELLRTSTERGFAMYFAWGTVLRGWTLVATGKIAEGIAQMRQGQTTWQNSGAESLLPGFLLFQAQAYGMAGQAKDGLQAVTEALATLARTGECTFEAELHRARGQLLMIEGDQEADAEMCFQNAMQIARRQSARSWELRAAMSLGRLWHKQGKVAQARELLQGVCNWFTEGFDTVDLQEAKMLLDALG